MNANRLPDLPTTFSGRKVISFSEKPVESDQGLTQKARGAVRGQRKERHFCRPPGLKGLFAFIASA
jgi:hypothetical protein